MAMPSSLITKPDPWELDDLPLIMIMNIDFLHFANKSGKSVFDPTEPERPYFSCSICLIRDFGYSSSGFTKLALL